MCQISISQSFGVSPRWYQSAVEKCCAELCVTSGLLHFFCEIKSMERAPMNSKRQSHPQKDTHITEML